MRVSTLQSAQNGLRLTPGDWRVSAGGVRLAQQTAMQNGVGAFVQALMARYKGRQTRWSSLDLVLRQRPSGMIMPRIYEIDRPERAAAYIHEVQMQVAPRLHLTIRGETSIRQQRSIERVERTVREQLVHYLGTRGTGVTPRLNLTIRGETHILHERSVERVERTVREQLVHYLSARGTRIDAVATQGSPTASGLNKASSPGMRADLPLAGPVSRVVRRPVAEPAITDRALTVEAPMMLPGQRPAVASRTNPPDPASIDVNRLTDQVIQAIDRRIVAQRERLGRM